MTIHHDDLDKWVAKICAALEEVAESIESSAPTDDALDKIADALARIATVLEKGLVRVGGNE